MNVAQPPAPFRPHLRLYLRPHSCPSLSSLNADALTSEGLASEHTVALAPFSGHFSQPQSKQKALMNFRSGCPLELDWLCSAPSWPKGLARTSHRGLEEELWRKGWRFGAGRGGRAPETGNDMAACFSDGKVEWAIPLDCLPLGWKLEVSDGGAVSWRAVRGCIGVTLMVGCLHYQWAIMKLNYHHLLLCALLFLSCCPPCLLAPTAQHSRSICSAFPMEFLWSFVQRACTLLLNTAQCPLRPLCCKGAQIGRRKGNNNSPIKHPIGPSPRPNLRRSAN